MPAVIMAVILATMLVAGGGGVYAAQGSMPGDMLYPVKTGMEQVSAALTRGDQARARAYMSVAERRMAEMQALGAAGQWDQAAPLGEVVIHDLTVGAQSMERSAAAGHDVAATRDRLRGDLTRYEALRQAFRQDPKGGTTATMPSGDSLWMMPGMSTTMPGTPPVPTPTTPITTPAAMPGLRHDAGPTAPLPMMAPTAHPSFPMPMQGQGTGPNSSTQGPSGQPMNPQAPSTQPAGSMPMHSPGPQSAPAPTRGPRMSVQTPPAVASPMTAPSGATPTSGAQPIAPMHAPVPQATSVPGGTSRMSGGMRGSR